MALVIIYVYCVDVYPKHILRSVYPLQLFRVLLNSYILRTLSYNMNKYQLRPLLLNNNAPRASHSLQF